ncbi:hypothetical protein F4821DRAFT_263783 [Hypoxylon rubiginosum]|uniref:Uncharacterized protein n=1 Tax=Hypoxylon rubiginosum TaxID=110542 RepID=A0ACC0CQA1_9PEZI|nr:hypothetical protein F4821DRAFT_263783 [Hypoxylon rubiginosum]
MAEHGSAESSGGSPAQLPHAPNFQFVRDHWEQRRERFLSHLIGLFWPSYNSFQSGPESGDDDMPCTVEYCEETVWLDPEGNLLYRPCEVMEWVIKTRIPVVKIRLDTEKLVDPKRFRNALVHSIEGTLAGYFGYMCFAVYGSTGKCLLRGWPQNVLLPVPGHDDKHVHCVPRWSRYAEKQYMKDPLEMWKHQSTHLFLPARGILFEETLRTPEGINEW